MNWELSLTIFRMEAAVAAARCCLKACSGYPQTAALAAFRPRRDHCGHIRRLRKGLNEIKKWMKTAEDRSRKQRSITHLPRSIVHVCAGRLMEAEKALSEALGLVEQIGLYGQLFSVHNNIGVCYMESGKISHALTHFQHAFALARGRHGPGHAPIVDDNYAQFLFHRGDHEEAITYCRSALASGGDHFSRGFPLPDTPLSAFLASSLGGLRRRRKPAEKLRSRSLGRNIEAATSPTWRSFSRGC